MTAVAAAPPSHQAVWIALALAVTLLVITHCCLAGRHAQGASMAAFGPICRALR
jgi:hypothetical protein